MITLSFIDSALDFLNSFLLKIPIIANAIDTFGNLFSELSYPDVLIDYFRIARLFLPTGTIVVLFSITCILIGISLLTGLVYFLAHLGNII